jgi:hypothetical protein
MSLSKKEKEWMAQRTIYVKRHFVNQLITRNLQCCLENRKKYGAWSSVHPDRWSIQFDPKTGQYEQAFWSGAELKTIDVHPGWKFTALPRPESELELQAMKESIESGACPFMDSEGPDYRLEVID